MSISKGKHVVEEIDGVRCTVVETGADEARTAFIRKILELNGYVVKMEPDNAEGGPVTYKVGVTDIVFHMVVDIYKRRLYTPSGKRLTPAYWLQQSSAETEAEVNYYTQHSTLNA